MGPVWGGGVQTPLQQTQAWLYRRRFEAQERPGLECLWYGAAFCRAARQEGASLDMRGTVALGAAPQLQLLLPQPAEAF
jgi:hypothetical protein